LTVLITAAEPEVVDEDVRVGDGVLALAHQGQQVGGLAVIDGLARTNKGYVSIFTSLRLERKVRPF
jgi:hypothetical protein